MFLDNSSNAMYLGLSRAFKIDGRYILTLRQSVTTLHFNSPSLSDYHLMRRETLRVILSDLYGFMIVHHTLEVVRTGATLVLSARLTLLMAHNQ